MLERALSNQETLSKVGLALQQVNHAVTVIGTNYKIEIDNEKFYIDVLLHHKHLNCLVAVSLKSGNSLPEYMGDMQFYLAVLDDKVKQPYNNPSIGMVICNCDNETIIEYSLQGTKKTIYVVNYQNIIKYITHLANETEFFYIPVILHQLAN